MVRFLLNFPLASEDLCFPARYLFPNGRDLELALVSRPRLVVQVESGIV